MRTGDVLSPPALEPLPIYEAREEGGAAAGPARAAAGRRRGGCTRGRTTSRRPSPVRRRCPAPRSTTSSLDDVDLTDLDVWEERVPYDWFALLRRDAPLHWQPEEDGRGFWALTRYDDVLAVSKDWQTFSSELGGTSLQDLTPEELEARTVDDRHRPAAAHAPARARQQGLHAARRQHLRGAHPRARARHPRPRVRRGRVRLGPLGRRGDPDVGLLRHHGPAGRGSEADHRARRQDPRQHRSRGRRTGERRRGRAQGPRAPQAPVLEPVLARPDRVRPAARRAAAPGAARGHHDEAGRGRDRRLEALRAGVRRHVHPAHDRGQRDDAPHDLARPPRPAHAPRGAAAAGRRPVARRRPPRTSSCGARTRCTTSAAPRPGTSSCTAAASRRATR